MSKKKNKGVSSADLFGPVLFIAGSLIALLMIGVWFRGIPLEGASGTGALARSVSLAMGAVPAMLFASCVAAMGVWVFLSSKQDRLLRDLSGCFGASLGLSFLLGAFSETAGGAVGSATGGALASVLTTFPAAILGLLACAGPIWFTWLRGVNLLPKKNLGFDALAGKVGLGEGTSSNADAAVSVEESEALLPDLDTTLAQRKISEVIANEGSPAWISNNESTNPYPDDVRLQGAVPAGASALTDERPPSDEAHGKDNSTAESDGGRKPVDSNRWTPGGTLHLDAPEESADAAHGPDEDLVAAADVLSEPEPEIIEVAEPEALVVGDGVAEKSSPVAKVLEIDPVVPAPAWETADEEVDSGELESPPGPDSEVEPESGEESSDPNLWRPVGATGEAADDQSTEQLEEKEEPSEDDEWEYVEVAEGEEGWEDEDDDEEEKIETPASVAQEEEEADEEDDDEWEYVEVAEGEEGWEDAEEEVEDEVEEDGASPLASKKEESDLPEEESDEDEWEYVEVAEGEEGWEDAEEVEEEEPLAQPVLSAEVVEPEAEPEPEPEAEPEPGADESYEREFAELLAQEESELKVIEEAAVEETELEVAKEPEVEPPVEEEAELPEPEQEPETVAEAAEPELEAEAEAEADVLESAEEPKAPKTQKPKKPKKDKKSKRDKKAAKAPTVEEKGSEGVQMDLFAVQAQPELALSPEPEPEQEQEPVVVLTPQVAPGAAVSPTALEAAELILGEARVAVSLLQRGIGLDFKESCLVLDELQELGFIGPYVDGNSRDILMSRDEWLSVVGAE